MTTNDTITGTVDEQGRTSGFTLEADAGSFGEDLQPGMLVALDDGGEGVIAEVSTRIHTGNPGQSNYVYVDIYPANR